MKTYSTSGSNLSPTPYRTATVSSGGSSNVKGSWVSAGSATTSTAEAIAIVVGGAFGAYNFMIDVGINVGGATRVLAENLSFNADLRVIAESTSAVLYLPLHVPTGSVIEFRAACSTGGSSVVVNAYLFGTGLNGTPGYSRLVALTTPNSSRGVTVDCGGTANTNVRTQLVASTAVTVQALLGMVGPNHDASAATNARTRFSIDVGAAGSEAALWPGHQLFKDTTTDSIRPSILPAVPLYLPAGSRLSALAQSTSIEASDRTFDLMVYGFQ
jgi:hypothetical protein